MDHLRVVNALGTHHNLAGHAQPQQQHQLMNGQPQQQQHHHHDIEMNFKELTFQ